MVKQSWAISAVFEAYYLAGNFLLWLGFPERNAKWLIWPIFWFGLRLELLAHRRRCPKGRYVICGGRIEEINAEGKILPMIVPLRITVVPHDRTGAMTVTHPHLSILVRGPKGAPSFTGTGCRGVHWVAIKDGRIVPASCLSLSNFLCKHPFVETLVIQSDEDDAGGRIAAAIAAALADTLSDRSVVEPAGLPMDQPCYEQVRSCCFPFTPPAECWMTLAEAKAKAREVDANIPPARITISA